MLPSIPHFGVLNVNKPAGRTSRDVVNHVERLVRPSKAGHAGTLDPLASGVLVICVGQATRLIQYVQQMPKQYRATFLLGRHSATDDVEMEATPLTDPPIPSRAELDAVLPHFLGVIQQRPPAHSAIKIAGQRAYKLARCGKAVELAARPVTIHRLAVQRYEYPELEIEIECGSGTYVRSLGRDLAASLSTAAVMSALERTAIGQFRVEAAVSLDALTDDTIAEQMQPAVNAVSDLPRIMLDDVQLAEIRHGRPIASSSDSTDIPPVNENSAEHAATDSTGTLVAILYQKNSAELWPKMNLV